MNHNKANQINENVDAMENKTPFVCNTCNKCFSTKGNLHMHRNIHLAEKTFKCTQCLSQFYQKQNVKAHEKKCQNKLKQNSMTVDNKENTVLLTCNVCHKYFKTMSDLYLHTKIHLKERPFKCNQCSKQFSQKGNMKKHVKTKHIIAK